jgi:hypothetical protein
MVPVLHHRRRAWKPDGLGFLSPPGREVIAGLGFLSPPGRGSR